MPRSRIAGCTELHVVETMHERKQAFTDLSDGFVTLPGGTGTMDELWEAMSWAQLGYHAKPVGLLNVAGYYDGLLALLGEDGARSASSARSIAAS